jgi:hypothetical protein
MPESEKSKRNCRASDPISLGESCRLTTVVMLTFAFFRQRKPGRIGSLVFSTTVTVSVADDGV